MTSVIGMVPAHKEKTARKEYGDYFHEILEGSIVNKESVTRLDL
jgi:hypothetical protein